MTRASLPLLGLLLAACNTKYTVTRPEPSSFRVHITCAGNSPADCPTVDAKATTCPASPAAVNIGTPVTPVSRNQSYYQAQITAVDSQGNDYPGYTGTANVYIQFEGSVTPPRSNGVPPLATVPVQNGKGCLALTTPIAFNETTLWVEDPSTWVDGATPGQRKPFGTFAVGVSETIYRPAPQLTDVAFTNDPIQQTSALNNKHVIVDTGTSGAPIVVTSVSTSYFTVTDLGAPGPDHPWGSVEVYTYSQPFGVNVGATVRGLNGTLSNYLGLPELGFPIWEIVNPNPDPVNAPLPAPHLVRHADLPQTLTLMAPYKSSVVQVKSDSTDTWVVCALRGSSLASYQKYGEWLIAPPTADCSSWSESLNVVSTASLPNFDPIANAGKKICSLGGMLSVVVPAAHVNLWTITPRGASDLGAVVPLSTPCP